MYTGNFASGRAVRPLAQSLMTCALLVDTPPCYMELTTTGWMATLFFVFFSTRPNSRSAGGRWGWRVNRFWSRRAHHVNDRQSGGSPFLFSRLSNTVEEEEEAKIFLLHHHPPTSSYFHHPKLGSLDDDCCPGMSPPASRALGLIMNRA